MMYKFLLTLLLILGVSGNVYAKDKLDVLTTTQDLASIAGFVGGDKVKVNALCKGYQDPHALEAKPSYMIKAKKADLFIRVGLELEIGYEDLILDGSRNQKIRVGHDGHLDVSPGVQLLEIPTTQRVDRSMGDVHPMGNPHYWLDPLNAKVMAENIAGKLIELSPENTDYFVGNLNDFNRRIDEKMVEWTEKLAPYEGDKVSVYHCSWPYFFERFGLVEICELEPKPGICPSPGHLAEVIDIMKREKVKLILVGVFYDPKAAEFVAKKTGSKVLILPNSVGGTKEAKDYFALIDLIVDKVVGGLKK